MAYFAILLVFHFLYLCDLGALFSSVNLRPLIDMNACFLYHRHLNFHMAMWDPNVNSCSFYQRLQRYPNKYPCSLYHRFLNFPMALWTPYSLHHRHLCYPSMNSNRFYHRLLSSIYLYPRFLYHLAPSRKRSWLSSLRGCSAAASRASRKS